HVRDGVARAAHVDAVDFELRVRGRDELAGAPRLGHGERAEVQGAAALVVRDDGEREPALAALVIPDHDAAVREGRGRGAAPALERIRLVQPRDQVVQGGRGVDLEVEGERGAVRARAGDGERVARGDARVEVDEARRA